MKRKCRRPKVVKTTVADSAHVVHKIEGGEGSYCRQPCPECPWREDATGKFPAEAFRISAHTSYDMAQEVFACHMRGKDTPATCAGFLLRGADDNLAVRLKRIRGTAFDVHDAGIPLHESYAAMAVANGVDPSDPVLEPCMPEARFRR